MRFVVLPVLLAACSPLAVEADPRLQDDGFTRGDACTIVDPVSGEALSPTLYEGTLRFPSADPDPCSSGISGVDGSLVIDHDATDLSALSCLCMVTGNVDIVNADRLDDLSGLEGLRIVGGSLRVSSNEHLGDVSALSSVRSIGRDLQLLYLPRITTAPFASLESIGDDLVVRGNLSWRWAYEWGIDDLDGFNTLRSIGGSIIVEEQRGLSTIDGFNALESIGGSIRIDENWTLRRIRGFQSLTAIPGSLIIGDGGTINSGNDDLVYIEGFPALTTIEGTLRIRSNDILRDVEGFAGLRQVGSLDVSYNEDLYDLEPLASIQQLDSLTIGKNDRLRRLGLSGLTHVAGNVDVFGNRNLVRLDLPNLTTVDGTLNLGRHADYSGNARLTTLELDSLTSIGRSLIVQSAPGLTDLTGLPSLQSIGRDLDIIGNDGLVDIAALEGTIGDGARVTLRSNAALEVIPDLGANALRGLHLQYNDQLTDLSGLGSVSRIDGDVRITYNDALTSTAGLDGLSEVTGSLWVAGESLSDLRFDALHTVDEALFIGRTLEGVAATDLTGLGALTHTGDLGIFNSPGLTTLAGLDQLTDVSGYLHIEDNPLLLDLSALHGVQRIDGTLVIRDNETLPQSEIDTLLQIVEPIVTGTVLTTNNGQ